MAKKVKDKIESSSVNQEETTIIRNRYERIAPFYNIMQTFSNKKFSPWRSQLWEKITGKIILEVGIGTGTNIPFYPDDLDITAIDFSEGMLKRAKRFAQKEKKEVKLIQADIQALPFEDNTFDTVIGTFVFCSIPDPVLGLKELRRVLKPGGKLLLLEHVLSQKPLMRIMMNLMNPLMVRLTGANINRETLKNLELAGFTDLSVEKLMLDMVLRIETIK